MKVSNCLDLLCLLRSDADVESAFYVFQILNIVAVTHHSDVWVRIWTPPPAENAIEEFAQGLQTSNTSSTGTCIAVTNPFVCMAMPMTLRSSPCWAALIPLALAAAVCEWMQYAHLFATDTAM